MIIPDYISPIIGYRVWRWDAAGLRSLNDEPWEPGKQLSGTCRMSMLYKTTPGSNPVTFATVAKHVPAEVPHEDCTCGIYAAKSLQHLRDIGYIEYGVHGEVYLWGTVREHKLGWRAQYAYPRSFTVPTDLLPLRVSDARERLEQLAQFGADISVQG